MVVGGPVRITVNGKERSVAAHATVADVLTVLGMPSSGVAVAVDGEVVRRADWSVSELDDGAAVEVLTAVQGG